MVFSKTSGYRHDSIGAGIAAIKSLSSIFEVDDSEDAESVFTSDSLGRYQVIVLLQCTGDFLDKGQVDSLKRYVQDGGGVVAIHGAAAGMLNDEWYGRLIGAHFDSHPNPEPGRVVIENEGGVASENGERVGWNDEWYNFRTHPRANKNLRVLLRGDVKSFAGSKMGDDHPLAWYQGFEGGRSYFTALGHFDEAYADEWYMEQISSAILWTAKHVDSLEVPVVL